MSDSSSLPAVFLSASIPDPARDPKYHSTGDVLNIREAIFALASYILPRGRLVFGGHPAISPFVLAISSDMGRGDRVEIYQSRFFEQQTPEASRKIGAIRWVDAVDKDRDRSLLRMREVMLEAEGIEAGVFIGGMEGVEAEYRMFTDKYPNAPALPVATTGAAAAMILSGLSTSSQEADMLRTEVDYPFLFEQLLGP